MANTQRTFTTPQEREAILADMLGQGFRLEEESNTFKDKDLKEKENRLTFTKDPYQEVLPPLTLEQRLAKVEQDILAMKAEAIIE